MADFRRSERVRSPMTAAGWFWARREIAQRWRSLVVVGLLAGVAGGLTIAAVAGALRSHTAYSRYVVATAAPDAIVFGTQVGAHSADYSRVVALPEVEAAGTFELSGVTVTEIDGVGPIAPGALGALPPGDTNLYRTVSRPLLRHGRLPGPTRPDEIVVNAPAARKYHLHVGQHVEVTAAKNLDALYGAPVKVAVVLRSTIVGIGDSTMDHLFSPDDPGFEPSGAFMLKYGSIVGHAPNLVVKLKPGTDVDAFHRRAVALLRDPEVSAKDLLNVPVRDVHEDSKRVTHATDLETTGLLLFAVAVTAAALILVGQAITRVAYAMAESSPALRALGFTRRDTVRTFIIPFAVVVTSAVASAFVSAIALSRFFPVGLARRFDPDLGVQAYWRVIVPGLFLMVFVVLAIAWFGALRATSSRVRTRRSGLSRTWRQVAGFAPLPVALGSGLAVDSGTGRRALPVRPAISGTIVAVIGIVGALGLVHGIDDALARPSRSGQVFDASVTIDSVPHYQAYIAKLERLPEAVTIAHLRHGNADVNGAGLPLWDLEHVRGDMQFTLLSGNAPAEGEAAIGPLTAKTLDVRVGDELHIGGARPRMLRVSGICLLPESPHSSFDQGLWVRPATMRSLFGPAKTANDDEELVVNASTGTSPAALQEAISKNVSTDVDLVELPQDVIFLRDVRSLPIALAVFLMLLALAAVGHALATTVRRRRHDLAVLRAMGFRPRQSVVYVASLAVTVAVLGLVIGVPLGVGLGRLAWHWIATRTPLLYVAPLATLAVLLIVPATLLIANLLAAWPARRAARIPTAEVLRTE